MSRPVLCERLTRASWRMSASERRAWLVFALLAAVRVAWALWAGVQTGNDSVRYRNPRQWWRVFDLRQLMGPGQLLQVIALPGPSVAATVQTAVAALGWGWAALVVTRGLRAPARWPAVTALVALGWTPWWLVWDTWLLTESLTTTGCVLFAAGLGRLVGTQGRDGWRPLAVGGVMALLTRPLVAPLLLGLFVAAFLTGGRQLRRRIMTQPRRRLAVTGLVVVWSLVQVGLFQHAVDPLTPRANTITGIQAADRFLGRAPEVASYVPTAIEHGMPPCPLVQTRILPGTVHHVRFLHAMPCREFQAWLDRGGLPWTTELAAHPTDTLRDMLTGTWTGGPQAGQYGWTDRRFRPFHWFIGHRWSNALRHTEQTTWWLMAVSAAALFCPGRRWPARAALLVVVAGWCAGMWLVDGIEYWRHLLPGFTVLPWLATGCWGGTAASRGSLDTDPAGADPVRA